MHETQDENKYLMYLCPRRTEERAQYGIVVDLRHGRAILGFNRKINPFERKNRRMRNEKKTGRVRLYFLEGQLHVLFIVVVIDILSEVMHGKEVGKSNGVVQQLVFREVLDEQRHFVHLAQRGSVQDNYK